MKNKKLILFWCITFFYVGMSNAMNSTQVNNFPADAQFITMQKTVINGNLKTIDILFKYNKNKYFFWQYSPVLNEYDSGETNVSCMSNSIDIQQYRALGIQNQYSYAPLYPTAVPFPSSLHDTPIEKIKIDSTYIATQSTYPNIRFWENFGLQQNNIKDAMLKEISKAWLLEYKEGNAIWAKRDFLNKTILGIYIGFSFSKQGKSFIFKKDIHDFVSEKEIMAMPFINNSYMPACFLEKNHAAIFNERQKKIVIITYKEKISTGNSNKRVGTITNTSIFLKDFKPAQNSIDSTELLYRTPKKIDYNKSNNNLVLVYDDRIIKCNFANDKYTYNTVFYFYNVTKMNITDVIIDNHVTAYILVHNQSTKTYELSIQTI